MAGLKVAVVGGYGGMGRVFARLFREEGAVVVISGPTESKGVKAAGELGVKYVRSNLEAVEGADVVVVTVPIAVTADVIREVAPRVGEGCLLMDLTSVKEEPCRLMAEHSKPGVEVVGAHPIFGPRVESIDGQVFVLTPVRGSRWFKWLKDVLSRHHARVTEASPSEHDEVMAVVQGLTHFAYISLGKTFDELGFDLKRSRQFSSPIYEMMLDMIGRIVGQDPSLYAEIQMKNPKVPRIHEAYLRTAEKLSTLVRQGDEGGFVQMMAEAARHFDDVERAMGRSDKAISSLISELEKLKGSVGGGEICVKHIYSGRRHLGVVKSVSADEVVLADRGKEQAFKLSNIVVLDDAGRVEFKAGKYGVVSRDYSVVLLAEADESFISRLIMEDDENIRSVKVKDVYGGGGLGRGMKSVCFGVEFINNDVKATDARVREFFTRIGGRLR